MPRPVVLGLINVSHAIVPIAQRRQEMLQMIGDAGKSGCQIVMTPEFADHHRTTESHAAHKKGRDEVRKTLSLRLDSPWMKEVSALAVKYKMVVIPDVMLDDSGRWFNSAVVFGPNGNVLGQYRKNPYTAPGEVRDVRSGRRDRAHRHAVRAHRHPDLLRHQLPRDHALL